MCEISQESSLGGVCAGVRGMLLPNIEGKSCGRRGDDCSDEFLDRSEDGGRLDVERKSSRDVSKNNSSSSGGIVEGIEVMKHD